MTQHRIRFHRAGRYRRSTAHAWTGRSAVATVALAVVVGLTAGLAAPAAAGAAPSRWQWPLDPRPAVVVGFDPPDQHWNSGHRGVDLAAQVGALVYAAGAGVVTFAGPLAGRDVVVVDHGELRTTYLPVDPSVEVGDVVAAGDMIGTVELIGGHCLPRVCLHWGLLRGSEYLNPLSLVGAGPLRLLPLGSGASPPGRTVDETMVPIDLGGSVFRPVFAAVPNSSTPLTPS